MTDEPMEGVHCGQCGKPLSEGLGLDHGQRSPCPFCGSRARAYGIVCRAVLSVTDTLQGLARNAEGEESSFFETMRAALALRAERDATGKTSYHLAGRSPQGESDTLAACRILRDRWNEEVGDWDDIEFVEELGGDCLIKARSPATLPIRVQVVRANVRAQFWRGLNLGGAVEGSESPEESASILWAAVAFKANATPEGVRPGLVLVLDASRLAHLAFAAPVRAFRGRHQEEAAALGFKAIWLVGPNPSLTWRLNA